MGEDNAYRVPKTRPHEEEDDFDFRRVNDEEEDLSDVYVIYEDENMEEEFKDKIKELGFTFNGENWESQQHISKDKIQEMEYEGIIIHKI